MPALRGVRATAHAALAAALLAGLPGAALAQEVTCAAFQYREDAQDFFDHTPGDPFGLDADGDGEACESLPREGAPLTTPRTPYPGPLPSGVPRDAESAPPAPPPGRGRPVPPGGRDCAEFPTQAEAQGDLDTGARDAALLDADRDGVACEEHFGTEGRQVAVHPVGGVATGGMLS